MTDIPIKESKRKVLPLPPLQVVRQHRNKFYSRIERTPQGCWEWKGIKPGEYGRMWIASRIIHSHRVSYMMHHGEIPHGMFVCHRCDVSQCCNPAHLFLGSSKDNSRDMCSKGRNAEGARNGVYTHPKLIDGKIPGYVRLNDSKILNIRKAYDSGGSSISELSRENDVSTSCISEIVKRLSWRHVV